MNEKILFYSAIAKVRLNSDDISIITDYISKNNSIDFFISIYRHKVQYLFFKHLLELKVAKKIDRNILNILNAQFSFLQLKHKEWITVLKNVTERLDAEGIDYAILKGIGLSNELYTFNGLNYRDYNDIDILIEKKDVAQLNETLEKLGFIQGDMNDNYEIEKSNRQQIIYFSLNSHQEKSYIKFSKYSEFSPLNRLLIDVNTTIFEGGKISPKIDTKTLLSNTVSKKINDFSYRKLSLEYNLIQLCYHFYKDTVYEIKKKRKESYCLMKFCDIREYILKYQHQLNWDNFINILNENNLSEEINYVLKLISSFYKDVDIERVIKKLNFDESCIEKTDLSLLIQ